MPLRHTLLGLLQASPLHGYRLRKQARTYSWIYPMTNTSIYPTLHGLEQEGFVTHHSEIHNGRARKVYELTEDGGHELFRWLTEAPTQDTTLRDQLLLKVAMLDDVAMASGARAWLESALVELRSQVAGYESGFDEPVPGERPYLHCAREYGVEVLKLRVRLLERVLAVAAEREAGSPASGEEGSVSFPRRA